MIDERTIEKISKTKLFNDNKLNDKLFKLHKELLRIAKNKNDSNEVGILWNIMTDEYVIERGNDTGINMRNNTKMMRMLDESYCNSLVFIHNHPRNSCFSFVDLKSFCDYDALIAMTAVCNDGRIHIMRKEADFNPNTISVEYNEYVKRNMSGISNIIKNASKLGLLYRCSVTRKGE